MMVQFLENAAKSGFLAKNKTFAHNYRVCFKTMQLPQQISSEYEIDTTDRREVVLNGLAILVKSNKILTFGG